MKLHLLFLMSLYLCSACKTPNNTYLFEQKILDCFYEKNNKQDVIAKINRLEKIYIEHKILKDKSGKSKIEFIEKIKQNGNTIKFGNKDLIKAINNIEISSKINTCQNLGTMSDLNSSEYLNSKFIVFQTDFYQAVSNTNDINPELIATQVLKHFTAEDFENEFYRVVFFIASKQLYQEEDI